MAKFTMIFENAEVKKELEFRGKKYGYTMKPSLYGMSGDGPSFYTQLLAIAEDDDDFLEKLDDLDFGNEDDVRDAVNYLSEVE